MEGPAPPKVARHLETSYARERGFPGLIADAGSIPARSTMHMNRRGFLLALGAELGMAARPRRAYSFFFGNGIVRADMIEALTMVGGSTLRADQTHSTLRPEFYWMMQRLPLT